jgi:DNA-binding NarL/FixJ family response regulator
VARLACLLVDDHPAILDAVERYLATRGIDVVGQAASGEAAIEQLEATRPPVAVVDIAMPGIDGIELARRAARVSPGTAIVLYTAATERALLAEALDAGVRGFVRKTAPLPELVRAIEAVAAGQTYVDPVLTGDVAAGADEPQLTRREREVLRLLASGLRNEEIGKRLYLSPETVRAHIRKATQKLGAETRTEAVALAIRRDLIS